MHTTQLSVLDVLLIGYDTSFFVVSDKKEHAAGLITIRPSPTLKRYERNKQ